MSDFLFSSSKRNSLSSDEFYYSDEGYIVFTEKYHLNRGFCCKNRCKHCPFDFDIKTDLKRKK